MEPLTQTKPPESTFNFDLGKSPLVRGVKLYIGSAQIFIGILIFILLSKCGSVQELIITNIDRIKIFSSDSVPIVFVFIKIFFVLAGSAIILQGLLNIFIKQKG